MAVYGAHARVDVASLLASRAAAARPLVLITEADLHIKDCESAFGYADPRRRLAVVSTFRLRDANATLARTRLENVIAHELGHLAGLGHCATPDCLMRPAQSLSDLDARSHKACPRCLRPRPKWPVALLAAAACLLLFFGLDSIIQAATKRTLPFAAGPRAAVTYKGQPLARAANQDDARRLAHSLNGLFVQLTPPRLEAEPTPTGARLHTAGVTLFEFTNTANPLPTAQQLAARLDPILRGKGSPAEGCPACHLNRTGEVIESAQRRAHLWR